MQSSVLSNNPAEDIAPVSPFGAVDYGTTEAELAKLAAQYSHITQVTTRKEFDAAQAAVTALIRVRTSIESKRKTLKADSLEFGKLVDSTAKKLIAVVTPEEDRIDALIEAVKRQKEAEKAERDRIEKARVDAILARIEDMRIPPALTRAPSVEIAAHRSALEHLLIDETFQEFQERAQETKTNVLAELNELYAGALHDERIAAQEKAERERVASEQKAESERLAKAREELDAIRKQNEAEQAERIRIEQEQAASERAEIARQHAELQAERDRIAAEKRAEAERVQRQLEAKAEAELKAAAKIEADRLAAEAKERADRLRPDREKVEAFASAIEAIEIPELSPEVQKYVDELRSIIVCAASEARDFAAKVCA